jgi:predicted nucleic acid-binding protein
VIAVDTSVVVAAFASWHEGHRAASAVLARHPRVPVQVLVETYSVLTRLPPPHRAPASLVSEFLSERFRSGSIALPAGAYRRVIEDAVSAGIRGGSVYDAVIAATARHAKCRLVTRDRRATSTYDRLGVDYELAT